MIYHVVPQLWEMEKEGALLFIIYLSVLFLGDFFTSKTKILRILDLFPCSGAGIGSPFSTDGKDDALWQILVFS